MASQREISHSSNGNPCGSRTPNALNRYQYHQSPLSVRSAASVKRVHLAAAALRRLIQDSPAAQTGTLMRIKRCVGPKRRIYGCADMLEDADECKAAGNPWASYRLGGSRLEFPQCEGRSETAFRDVRAA